MSDFSGDVRQLIQNGLMQTLVYDVLVTVTDNSCVADKFWRRLFTAASLASLATPTEPVDWLAERAVKRADATLAELKKREAAKEPGDDG